MKLKRFMDKVNHFNRVGENMMIFNKNQRLINSSDTLKKSISDSVKKGFLFPPSNWAGFKDDEFVGISDSKERKNKTAIIEVTKEGSFEAVKRLRKEFSKEKICVLNFASARNPGGAVTRGSSAQEEELCRVSTLYNVIKDDTFSMYYNMYEKGNYLYNDILIYTPNISIFLDPETKEPVKKPLKCDVITSAFPNLRHYSDKKISKLNLDEIYLKRIENVFQAAVKENVDILVLGAWGCGVFRNDPKKVASSFKKMQDRYGKYFDMIVYPVFCRNGEEQNYEAFKKVIGDKNE